MSTVEKNTFDPSILKYPNAYNDRFSIESGECSLVPHLFVLPLS